MTIAPRDLQNAEIKAALEEIAAKHDGVLNPRDVVEAAREEDHPLHSRFEWDDSSAAEKFRLAQAEGLIRRVRLHLIRPPAADGRVSITTTRAFQSRPSQRTKDGGYEPIGKIMADPEKRKELVDTVARELLAIRRRYGQLVELAEIWFAVDTALADYEDKGSAGEELRPSA